MRLILQRVKQAAVVNGQGGELAKIGPGFLCYIGVSAQDTAKDAEWVSCCGRFLICTRLIYAPSR